VEEGESWRWWCGGGGGVSETIIYELFDFHLT
jgi:hypothetical protein